MSQIPGSPWVLSKPGWSVSPVLAPVYNKCLTRLHVNSGELGLSQGLQEGHDCQGLGCHVTPSWASVSFLGIDWRFRTPWGQEDLGGSSPGLIRAPTPKPGAQAPGAGQPGDTMLTYRLPVTLNANRGHMTMTVTGSGASLRLPAPTPCSRVHRRPPFSTPAAGPWC